MGSNMKPRIMQKQRKGSDESDEEEEMIPDGEQGLMRSVLAKVRG